jgi:hypothetical protein
MEGTGTDLRDPILNRSRRTSQYKAYSIAHAQECASLGDALLLVAGDDAFVANEARRVLSALRPSAKGSQ